MGVTSTELDVAVPCLDRIWAVDWVTPSSLPIDPTSGTRPQHLIRMCSLEDDGVGGELTAIGEIESHAQVTPYRELPRPDIDRLDAPERLEAFLDAVRWGAVATADSRALPEPFRSGITIEDYQLSPVMGASGKPRANLLIADALGLGKLTELVRA